jgi:hypothetical protein
MMQSMRRMRWAAITLISATLLVLPSSAVAAHLAPPGKAGANQYFETIPTSAGNAAPPSGAVNPRPLARLGAGRRGAERLARLGKTGAAAAALAHATAPVTASGAAQSTGAPAQGTGRPAPATVTDSGGQSPVSSVVSALGGSDSGGLGLVLPLLLVTALIVAFGFAVVALRPRRGGAGLGPDA